MSEREAIARMKRGEIGGLEELVVKYQMRAVRATYLITHDLSLSEDIVQAAFLRAYERIGQFDPSRPFGPWFLRSVVNDAVKAVRKRNRSISLDEEASEEATSNMTQTIGAERIAAYDLSLEEQLDRLDTNEALSVALAQLPAEQRAALVMRYYLGLTDAEISARLDCTPGTVRWRLHRARERLRRLLPLWANPDWRDDRTMLNLGPSPASSPPYVPHLPQSPHGKGEI